MNQRPLYTRQLERAEVKVLDVKIGRVSAVVSTETRDRDRDIIRVDGWDLDNFMKHPVMLDSHHYGSLMAVIGRWDDMAVKGKKLIGEGTYHIGRGNPAADWAFVLAEKNLAAFSVGFLPDMSKAKELEGGDAFWPSLEFNGQELLETSQVSVPSNPDGLQRMKGLHPVLDRIIEEKLVTITIDDDPHVDEDIKSIVAEIQSKNLDARLKLIEEELIPLIKLLHTHPGGPEPDVEASEDEATEVKFLGKTYMVPIIRSLHGEHDHDSNGSHEHDGDKTGVRATIDFTQILREATEEARR